MYRVLTILRLGLAFMSESLCDPLYRGLDCLLDFAPNPLDIHLSVNRYHIIPQPHLSSHDIVVMPPDSCRDLELDHVSMTRG